MSESHDYDSLLDTCGLSCPEPVILLHNAVRDIRSGQVVKVLATDPATQRDIPKFCKYLGHSLMATFEEGDVPFNYLVRKK